MIGIQKPHKQKLDMNRIQFAKMGMLVFGNLTNPSPILNGNALGQFTLGEMLVIPPRKGTFKNDWYS